MSIRTILEINHDYLNRLMENPEYAHELWMLLASCDSRSIDLNKIPGVRFIGDRHHSETKTFTVESP